MTPLLNLTPGFKVKYQKLWQFMTICAFFHAWCPVSRCSNKTYCETKGSNQWGSTRKKKKKQSNLPTIYTQELDFENVPGSE